MDVKISLDVDGDAESLWDWLRQEPGLRGRTRTSHGAPRPGAMGGTLEMAVVAVVGGTATALVRALTTWLVQRRSDVTITVTTTPEGRTVSVSAQRTADPEKVLRSVLEPPAPGPTGDDSGASA